MVQNFTKRGSKRKSRRTRGSLASINDLLPKAVKRLNLEEHFNKLNLEKHYEDIFGSEIAKASNPDKIIKGTLYINVSSSAWLMQLSFMKDEFKKKINERLGKRLVKNITFKVGKVSRTKLYEPPTTSVSLRKVKLDDATKKMIKENVKGLKDDALKKSIIAAETAYYKRKEVKEG